MPQGRRKTPFSGKAKKEQLKLKKHNKNVPQEEHKKTILLQPSRTDDDLVKETQRINYQASKGSKTQSNKYALEFFRETDEEIRRRKEIARQCLQPAREKDLEVNIDDYFPKELDFPTRPKWSFDDSLEALNSKENKYFMEYVKKVESLFDRSELSYFELNLETWRQLWRVLEMSDIVLIIVDIRFPALMFPPSLYAYVTNTLKKNMILVLNKIDLVPAEVVVAWKMYFKEKYPMLHVVMFTSVPEYNLIGQRTDKKGLKIRKRKGKLHMAAEGTQLLFNTCKEIVGDQVDLTSWNDKIKEELSQSCKSNEEEDVEIEEVINLKEVDTGFFEHEKYKNGILTIGCLGQPNVGKSSLMNAIMGKKVVSVSKTPGHTKHFQTIFLTNNVRLCDCPGLVFPSKVPKTLQVLMGSFPIAQLREPFTIIKYLGEHLNLPRLLAISHPDGDEEWSAMDICDGWAKKRNFLTAKAARLDSYRAANGLLRMTLEGKICLYLRPPGFSQDNETWRNSSELEIVRWIQARPSETTTYSKFTQSDDDDEDGDDEDGDDDEEGSSSKQEKSNSDDSDSSSLTNEQLPTAFNKFSVLDC